MQPIQEIFLELDYDELEEALAARRTRLEELQSQGLICKAENLYNGSGHRVLILNASEPTPMVDPAERSDRRRQSRPTRQHKPREQEDPNAERMVSKKPIKLPKFEAR